MIIIDSFVKFVLKPLVGLWVIWLIATSIGATLQEQKIWKNPKLPSLTPFALLKVFLLNIMWMGLSQFGVLLTPLYMLATGTRTTRDYGHNIVERYVGQVLIKMFVGRRVEIRGIENLPPLNPGSPAPVMIANHDSQLDIAAVYYLNRSWRWIAKSSVFILPGVGQLMFIGGHVFIDRVKKNNKSFTGTRNLYVKSNESLQEGVPMFFFPQGTRRLGERLPFKDGAFKIAKENGSIMIPISIEIPLTAWNSNYPFDTKVAPIVLTIHKPIESKDFKEVEALKEKCFETIYSVLPDFTKQS
eukprot:scaffold22559_cov111-Cylindrotheca_fusiformis.AAC.6